MEEVKSFYQAINDICAQDQRYKPDSYEFVMQALNFTQKEFKKPGHISGQELLEGIRKFALDQYGPMAKTVLQHWGITKTSDFGNIVFNMIESKVLSKTENDTRHDFDEVYDFQTAFKNIVKDLQI
jgi:uncharacterized repeat protein (TIGR04138 family)